MSATPKNPPAPPSKPPVVTRPPNKPPNKNNAEILQDIDSSLIALLALAHFGPAEQGTSRSVDQACAAEVLLFRLRSARSAVLDLADALRLELPARQVLPTGPPVGLGSTPSRPGLNGHPGRARGCPDGTVRPPTAMGGVRVPGHAAASDSSAAGGSGQGKAAPHAGTGAGSGALLPGADSGEGGPFRLPSPPGPPEFAAAVGQPGS
jgi:hypothetical protein